MCDTSTLLSLLHFEEFAQSASQSSTAFTLLAPFIFTYWHFALTLHFTLIIMFHVSLFFMSGNVFTALYLYFKIICLQSN